MSGAPRGGTVLIVDDDEALAENLAEIIQGLGVETVLAPDRKTALAIAGSRDLDVAMIDVRLPDGDGMSLLEPLRGRSPYTKSVLVTGNATLESAMEAVRAGAFAYVLKPFAPAQLLETVRRARDQAALERDRERLRVELERSEMRHRELVESVPAFVVALDAEGRITTWNRQLEEVSGFSRAEMLGRPGAALVAGGERPHPLAVREGSSRLVRWRCTQVHDADGAPITYAVGIDVTGEQEMLRRTMRAERLAAVGTMAAGLAHEVRNPLNSASLQLMLLQRRLEKGGAPDSALPIVQIIKSEIDRLDHLVRDFLAFAQPRPLEPRPVEMGALLASVAGLIHPEASDAGVTLGVEVAANTPPVSGEEERLRQVMLNLVRNAIEALHAGGGHVVMRARPATSDLREVEVEVEDDGPGFTEELPIFDAFFTTKPQGTGLGLALVHRIVTDHAGTIRVRSRPGSTCFTISLPSASVVAA